MDLKGKMLHIKTIKPYVKKDGSQFNGGYEFSIQMKEERTEESFGTPVEKFYLGVDKISSNDVQEFLQHIPCDVQLLTDTSFYRGNLQTKVQGFQIIKK